MKQETGLWIEYNKTNYEIRLILDENEMYVGKNYASIYLTIPEIIYEKGQKISSLAYHVPSFTAWRFDTLTTFIAVFVDSDQWIRKEESKRIIRDVIMRELMWEMI